MVYTIETDATIGRGAIRIEVELQVLPDSPIVRVAMNPIKRDQCGLVRLRRAELSDNSTRVHAAYILPLSIRVTSLTHTSPSVYF